MKAQNTPKKISIFGVTGSIGSNAVDVILKSPGGMFEVSGVSANKNYKDLAKMAIATSAKLAVIFDESQYLNLKKELEGTNINVSCGVAGMMEICALDNDLVVAAIVGSAGILSTYHAIKAGTNIALANKESLVCAGDFINKKVAKEGSKIIPVDSEHNAIFQVLEERNKDALSKIILTASGGPFRKHSLAELLTVTKREALKHPNWDMGSKVTIDSATMFNKGLEIIEAYYLFGVSIDDIDVLIHPESIVHSMVSYKDGSTLAQMGNPDMRTPITHAMYWPQRYREKDQIVDSLDLSEISRLNFYSPEHNKFPSLNIARSSIKDGGTAPIMMNASNEVAVEYFLNDRIKFLDIFAIVQEMLSMYSHRVVKSIEEVISLDKEFKTKTSEHISDVYL